MENKEVTEPEMKGWLYKWTNYIKGYQKRWFVLSNGLLSYYRTQAEMAHTCRGTISLHGAAIHCEDSCNFIISNVSNGGTQTFHLKTPNEIERQRWITALELAKAKAIRALDSEEDGYDEEEEPDKGDIQAVISTLNAKLEDLQTCHDLIAKHASTLHRSLADLENTESTQEVTAKVKQVNERATLFRITSTAMIKACADYRDLVQTHGRKWQRMFQHEREQRSRLEQMVEQLARQHSHLEQEAKQHEVNKQLSKKDSLTGAASIQSSDDEFEDAADDFGSHFTVAVPTNHKRSGSNVSQTSEGRDKLPNESDSSNEEDNSEMIGVIAHKPSKQKRARDGEAGNGDSPPAFSAEMTHKPGKSARKRRTTIPEKPNYPLNLWSIMKNSIGKELTKIPVPVNFSEPLSMLQRLTEDFEYSYLLDRAAECDDPCEQMCYVAAFTVSAYATTSQRSGKPFNPLLGETYECDRRDDYGWRVISEQVSHHPPMVAQHCEGDAGWECYQEFTMSSKFRGKYLQVIPLGISHLHFPKTGNHFTWRKVTTTVHNIIVGRLWVDQHGDMEITNHKTGDKCNLKYVPYSYFSRDVLRKVTGCVTDPMGQVRWVLMGTWDSKMECCKVLNSNTSVKGKPVIETGPPRLLWKANPVPEDGEKIYNFSQLAIELNEPEEGVAPTDSRLRPDQRLMEEGKWDEANDEKVRLEEKQRAVRRKREAEAEAAAEEGVEYTGHQPIWFRKDHDPYTSQYVHIYTGEYWTAREKQDWSRCPDIF
ncbi:oxysterol-binding protein 1-like isoform X2 [Amphibalanus amphitrite]|uniref:oxysterol-binding protein 1-like isoform X2 n=1 Tax=Amphibalanus amphitrite TaxID=1232801 RepID=UPI001C92243A|nr:oxysterol-binding protein 1-like isoform X2 [Amphibalanus amphitrite]XP_043239909.1 oxysterol-binding protein 1-like isoform X2 [Amphibalanus amphitrite]XP_043239910.1 oxysterol-binding protein 1-like isoform X2 [Amphibalanus amphitrite]